MYLVYAISAAHCLDFYFYFRKGEFPGVLHSHGTDQIFLFDLCKVTLNGFYCFQVKKLESETNPLKENITSLTSQKDVLVGEKTALKSEVLKTLN